MLQFSEVLAEVVSAPDIVAFEATHSNRENDYRQSVWPGASSSELYVKVCVELGPEGGEVITAYRTPRTKRGETQRWPDLETALSARVDYDPEVDSLFVAFDQRRPSVNIPLETGDRDYIYLVVDLDSDEVVGIEVEDVQARALGRHPAWAPLVAAAGADPQPIPPPERPALAAFLADVVSMASQ
jgi:hypothetical protein